VLRQTPPPWDAPRGAVSYIETAGLEPLPLDLVTSGRTVRLQVSVDGRPVEVPAYLGVDRARSVQAAAHTHDTSGTVWLEGKGADRVTLGQLFRLWGVRFDRSCLGPACGSVTVSTIPADSDARADPSALPLATVRSIVVVATS